MRGTEHLHPELQPIAKKFVEQCKAQGLNVLVTETYRAKAEQDKLYAQGRKTAGKIVTNAKYPTSPHCWGVAFDFCRNVKGREYDNSDKFFNKCGAIGKTLGLTWGGDWKGFVDLPHLELKKFMPNASTKTLVSKYGTPDKFKATWSTYKEGNTMSNNSTVSSFPEAQAWVKSNNISDGENPKENITREEVWAMLQRLAMALKK